MGLNDFFDAIVPESVENWAGGAISGAGAIASHLDDIARAGAWAANPTHYDDIARGAGKAAQYIGENPGKIWDTGFEVGRYMVKDQLLDPKNLAINLGMTAATIATGGGTSGLLAMRVANMGRAGVTALRAARGAGEGVSAMRAARAGWQTARAAESIGSGVRTAGRVGRALDKVDAVLGKETELRQAARRATPFLNNEGSFVTRHRNQLADVIAPEGSGLLRQAVGQSVGVNMARPTVAGAGTGAQNVANMVWRGRRAQRYEGAADTISEAGHVGRDIAQAESDPLSFGIRKANEHGYDPVGTARKAATKAVAKQAQKQLGGDKNKQRRPSAYTDMASTGGGTGYTAPSYSSAGPVMRSGAQARVSGEGYETVSTQIGRVPSRRSNFYGGTNLTYADQSEEDDD